MRQEEREIGCESFQGAGACQGATGVDHIVHCCERSIDGSNDHESAGASSGGGIDEFEGEKLLPEDFIKRNAPKTFTTIENKETLRNQLQTQYFDEVRKSGKDSIKALQIFREVEDLNEQIKKDKNKVKTDSQQSDLLTANENRAKQRLKELHQKHSDIFQTRNSGEKNALRRSVDLKILEFIQENLNEKEFAVNVLRVQYRK